MNKPVKIVLSPEAEEVYLIEDYSYDVDIFCLIPNELLKKQIDIINKSLKNV